MIPDQIDLLTKHHPQVIKRFEKIFYHFEAIKSKKGPVKVPDGVTWNAVFCMRSLLRELPQLYQENFAPIDPKLFMKIMRSSYAASADCQLNWYMRRKIGEFQKSYLRLLEVTVKEQKTQPQEFFRGLLPRVRIINRNERVTGDSVNNVTDILIEKRKHLTVDQFHRVIELFIKDQTLDPDVREAMARKASGQPAKVRNMMDSMIQTVRYQSEGL
jgi:hypothetical protein